MAEQLGALSALLENPSSVLSTHVRTLTSPVTPVRGGKAGGTHIASHRHSRTQTIKKKMHFLIPVSPTELYLVMLL